MSALENRGCKDALISESYLTLAFPDRIESWDLQKKEKAPSWSMEIKTQSESSGDVYFNISYKITDIRNMLNGMTKAHLAAFLFQDPL